MQNHFKGFKTEEVVNEILKRDPNLELLDGGKYRSNNGFDHVFRNKKTGEIWVLDSKQIAKSGNMSVSNKGVGGTRQMSPDWVDNVLDKLDTKNETRKAIESAINKGKINTGLVGVDKKTGELIFIPTRITNIKKEVISDTLSNTTTTNTTDIGTNYKYGNLFKGDFTADKKQYVEGSTKSTTYTSSYTVHNFIYTFELSGKNDKFRNTEYKNTSTWMQVTSGG